jgi:hypothetical protein
MGMPDRATLAAAIDAHKDGSGKFTRRMAINIADFFGERPMSIVWRAEKMGLLKSGSWDWFSQNGGITRKQVAEVRAAHDALHARGE